MLSNNMCHYPRLSIPNGFNDPDSVYDSGLFHRVAILHLSKDIRIEQ